VEHESGPHRASGPASGNGTQRNPRVLIIGAGFGGVATAIELRRHGLDQITILEAAPELGGTWFFNSYPGSACDVPSHLYSFSYEQRRDWSRLCSPQAEILDYLRTVADGHGITPLIKFSQRVSACRFDETSSSWHVETEGGQSYESDAVVIAAGQLNQPSIPPLPGLERFEGHSFHSARWDHDYDLRGKRVAVVGNGASAVQFVPQIAGAVDQLTVFQRTGNWMMPRRNHVYSPLVHALLDRVPAVQWLRRRWVFYYTEGLTLGIRHPRTVGQLLGRRSEAFMRKQLPDPELRARAWPDYTFGCKRVLFSSHYLPALGRPNVELVTDAITSVTETGIETADGAQREFDCIIWATGFKVADFVAPMRVFGRDGVELAERWRDGAHAHLGMAVPGFPSLFFVYGPNTNTSGGSIIVYLEAQAAYIRQALQRLRSYRRVEVRADVEAASDQELQSRFAGTAWTACNSWYQDEDGRIVANWPGYMREYVNRTRTLDPSEYEFSA
jgi:cation diffusion facilitator CzcD-associated flavoprotein CzcO